MSDGRSEGSYECKICGKKLRAATALVEHLRFGHSLLELAVFSGVTMLQEQRRDSAAMGLHRVLSNQLER